jgi:peptide/nickel transport system substrate-binding protein
MRALGAGKVIESQHPKFAVGDYVQGVLGVQDYFVGIEAKIEVIEQPKYFELNRGNQLPEATLYSWDNATGDPEMFGGYLLHPKLPFSSWKDATVGDRIMKLFSVVNYDERIKGYKEALVFASDYGAAIPLLQSVMTQVYKANLKVLNYGNAWVLPQTWSWT